MNIRNYNSETDRDAIHRIWQEVGWISDSDKQKKSVDVHLSGARVLVAEINGAAECMVAAMPGQIRHLDAILPLGAVTAVTTSLIARKQGLAKRLAARAIAQQAAEGAAVSGLGMFEQGFYNKLGFGSFGYEHLISFDPAQLNIKRKFRAPLRLGEADSARIHAALHQRMPNHGGVCITPLEFVQAEIGWYDQLVALGYADGPDDAITHCLIGNLKGEHGPLRVDLMVYQTWDQFLELLALLKSMGDQIRLMRIIEPPTIQFQDFLIQPFRYQQITDKSQYANRSRASAFMQTRINDVPACMAATHLPGSETVRFNLVLDDPIAKHLDGGTWQGAGGEYVITLGAESAAVSGQDASLPTLTASVGAFTRLWMGVLPASGLAVSAQLEGPPALLAALDRVLRLPQPRMEWLF